MEAMARSRGHLLKSVSWIEDVCEFKLGRSLRMSRLSWIDVSGPIPGIHHQCKLNNQRDENIYRNTR